MVTAQALLTELTLVGGGALTLAALLDLLMVTFGASGMDGAVRNQAAASGTQPVPYIGQLLNRYLGIVLDGISPASWAQPIQEGLSYLSNGTLYLTAAATEPIADFQRWAWEEAGGDLIGFAPVDVPEFITDGEYNLSVISCSKAIEEGNEVRYIQNDIGIVPPAGWSLITIGSSLPGTQYYVYGFSYYVGNSLRAQRLYAAPVNEYSACSVSTSYNGGSTDSFGNSVVLHEGEFTLIVAASSGSFTSNLAINESVLTTFDPGDFSGDGVPIGDPDTFVGPMQQGLGTQLPLADVVDVTSSTAARAHLFDYLHAGASAYAGTGVAELPVTDVDTGEDQVLPLNVPLDTPIGVTGVSDGTISGSGSLAGTDVIAGDFAGTDAYTMDLTQFFPFCIPFDLYALYQKFEAQAAAPVVDWPIPMPGGGDPLTVHLDFSAFDQLAVWVRRMELIAFAVGLMILTKNLIQGGD